MTSPRLSTVGTISAIEKALDGYWALADLHHNNQHMFLKHAEAIQAARAELAELRAQPEQGREVERREMFDLRGDAGHSWGLFAEREYAESTLRIISDFSVRVIPVEVFVRELEPSR